VEGLTRDYICELNILREAFNPYVSRRASPPPDLVDEISSIVLGYKNNEVARTFVADLGSRDKVLLAI